MKFCRDCKYQGLDNGKWVCTHISNMDIITGEPDNYCRDCRDDNWFMALIKGQCGKRGRFFEERSDA